MDLAADCPRNGSKHWKLYRLAMFDEINAAVPFICSINHCP